MQALLYSDWNTLEIVDVDRPAPGPADVLIRVAACGLCGSELETFKNRSARRTPPLVMGHEFCGSIEEVGASVADWKVGDRVVSNSVVPCDNCIRCRRGDSHLCADRQIFGMHRPGAFAEWVVVPARCLIHWPETVRAESACLAEPLANGVHIFNLTRHLPIKSVLVIGAGPIGLMCQQVMQVMGGATVYVSDVIAERRDAASRVGAEAVIDPMRENVVEVVRAQTEGEGVDLVIDAVGSERTKRQSLDATRPGGTTVWIGLHEDAVGIDSYAITLPERSVLGTYAARLSELKEAVDLMAAGKVEVTNWVKSFDLSDSVTAFDRMLAAEADDIKAVIVPGK